MVFRKPRRSVRVMIALMLLAAGFIMFFRWFERSQVYHPLAAHNMPADVLERPFEDVSFGDDPRLHAWFFPAPPESPRKQLALLICHGNGGNISHRLRMCDALLQTGINVFVFDYRGYGRSTGNPDEQGTYADAQAAYQFLRDRGFAPTNIVALGESLGGGVASELATRETLGGLILQSTFTCIPDIGAELFSWLPVRSLCSIHYDTYRKLPQLSTAVMIMHSRSDSLIRFQHAERNFSVAREPKMFWEIKGDHNDTLDADREVYVNGIEKFLRMIEGQSNVIEGI